MKSCTIALLLALAFMAVSIGNAFTITTSHSHSHRLLSSSSPSSSSLHMTILTYGGKKKDFKAGSPLKAACAALGVKPKYSCRT
jgi:hypothetical protein